MAATNIHELLGQDAASLLEPPGGFASWALVIGGAADSELTPAAHLEIEEQIGAMRLVWRRMG